MQNQRKNHISAVFLGVLLFIFMTNITHIEVQLFAPGLTYFYQEDKKETFWDEVLSHLLPYYSYVQKQEAVATMVEDRYTYEMLLSKQEIDEEIPKEDLQEEETKQEPLHTTVSIEQLRDYDDLVRTFYTVDSTTMVDAKLLNVDTMINQSMKINTERQGPKVLIFHTHSQEAFKDSVPGDTSTSIVGMGAHLANQLRSKGIETIHHTEVFDYINGKLDRSKAYQLAEKSVRKILKQYPSIEVVIDLHRDGVPETTHLVTEIDGKQCGKIMFFNGLSRTKTQGEIAYLKNPYLQDNLAFSFQMQLKTTNMYPTLARKIYLKGYRYSLHMMPKSLLIEAGAQTNSVEEMKNTMELLANVLSEVLL